MPIPGSGPFAGEPVSELPVRAARKAALPIRRRPPFQYWLDRTLIRPDGETYLPIKVSVTPGVLGVPDSGASDVLEAGQRNRLGREPIPLDMEVTAWGETREGYLCPLKVGEDAKGRPLIHHHDVWTRYLQVGSQVVTEFDGDGWADFCQRVTKLAGAPPHKAIVEAEQVRLAQLADDHRRMGHVSPAAEAEADKIEAKTKQRRRSRKAKE